jgi:hypothetical protein
VRHCCPIELMALPYLAQHLDTHAS